MKKLASLLLAVLGAITVRAQPQPPILRNPFTTNTPVAAQAVVTNIANAVANNASTNLGNGLNINAIGIFTNSTDQLGALVTAMTNMFNRHGGRKLVIPAGIWTWSNGIANSFRIPDNGLAPPEVGTWVIEGEGGHTAGQSIGARGGTRIYMDMTNDLGQIQMRGLGHVTFRNIFFDSRFVTNTPAIFITGTSATFEDCSWRGIKLGSNAWQTFLVAGGNTNTADYATNGPAGSFQGYPLIIRNCSIDQFATNWIVNGAANAVTIDGNWFRHGQGNPAAVNGYSGLVRTNAIDGEPQVGFTLINNIFEWASHRKGFLFQGASGVTIAGNRHYDATASFNTPLITATNGTSDIYWNDPVVDTAFAANDDPAGVITEWTTIPGKTNKLRNLVDFNRQVSFFASVPFAMFAADRSYAYPELSNDRVTWRWVSSDGTQNREMIRSSNLGEISSTNYTMFGSSSNNSPVAALGVNSSGNFTRMAIGSGSGTPGGGSLQAQYNTNNTFAGNSQFTFAPLTGTVLASNFVAAATVAGSTLLSSNPIPGSANSEVTLLSTNLNGKYFSLQAANIYSNLVLLLPTNGFAGITDPLLQVINITGTGGNHTGQLAWVSRSELPDVVGQDTGVGTAAFGALSANSLAVTTTAFFSGTADFNGAQFNMCVPAITVSNLTLTCATNHYSVRGATNVQLTNIVELASAKGGFIELEIVNTLAVSVPVMLPAFGAQHGYFFHTNGLNDVLSGSVAPPGTNTVWALAVKGTNIYPSVTYWRH